MGKAGKSSTGGGGTQKHIHSRIAYLYEAAIYLATAAKDTTTITTIPSTVTARQSSVVSLRSNLPEVKTETATPSKENHPQPAQHNESDKVSVPDTQPGQEASNLNVETLSRHQPQLHQHHHLLSSMRSISRKAQIRLTRAIKRSVCRRCDGLLLGSSTVEVENGSRSGRKPWADVLVVRCGRCGCVKRYPVGMGKVGRRKRGERKGRESEGGDDDEQLDKGERRIAAEETKKAEKYDPRPVTN